MFQRDHKIMALAAVTLASTLVSIAGAQVITTENFKILASDGAPSDSFTRAIAIGDGLIVAGSPFNADNGTFSGSAYIFDTAGNQLAKLLPDDGSSFTQFGGAVAIGNGIVAVGAFNDSPVAPNSGSVYLFDADPKSATFGAQLAKLTPDDAGQGDQFGFTVSISNGILAVGARLDNIESDDSTEVDQGSVYLYNVDLSSAGFGDQLVKVLANDGEKNDEFGSAVVIKDGIVAVGAHLEGVLDDEFLTNETGAVYLFDGDPVSLNFGNQLAKLEASVEDEESEDWFGRSVSISNGIVAIGATGDNEQGNNSGAAYLYDGDPLSPGFGTQLVKLTAFDGEGFDLLGFSISIDNGLLVAGAWFGETESAFSTGAAYLFNADPASAEFGTLISKLSPSDGEFGDAFGYAVGIEDGIVIVGAQSDDDLGSSSGSGYLFDLNAQPCAADLDGNGVLDFFDISAFLAAFKAQESVADFEEDGIFNFFDVSAYLAAFAAGCP